jgi:hypothetical protein
VVRHTSCEGLANGPIGLCGVQLDMQPLLNKTSCQRVQLPAWSSPRVYWPYSQLTMANRSGISPLASKSLIYTSILSSTICSGQLIGA